MRKARSYLGLHISATRFAYKLFPISAKKSAVFLQLDLRRNATHCRYNVADSDENFKYFLRAGCSSNRYSGVYPPYTDIFKARYLSGACFSISYNFPLFEKTNVIPRKLIPFDKIFIAMREDYDAYVHFFLPDICFEKIWEKPERYINQLKKFEGCILPDFSLCHDFSYPLLLSNCYCNRALGYILSTNGIPVIMNVSFSDSRSFAFCCTGIELGGIIATGSLGTMKNHENRETFTTGRIIQSSA